MVNGAATVLVTDRAEERAAVGFDKLTMVIRSDLRDPLRELNRALLMARSIATPSARSSRRPRGAEAPRLAAAGAA